MQTSLDSAIDVMIKAQQIHLYNGFQMTHISQFILHSYFQCVECNVAFRAIKTFFSEFFQTFWKGPEEDIWDAAVP